MSSNNKYPLDVTTNKMVTLKLYDKVKNVPELRKQIINGSLNCCIIKPSLIVDPFQIVVAANKAVLADKLTTKTIYTEILFNLSISSNITQSLQKFGIDDKETEIIVVVVHETEDEIGSIFKTIEGDEVEVSSLNKFSNEQEIRKSYKISDVELKNLSLLDSVVSRIASKDFL